MKKLIWKIRYALEVRKVSKAPWRYCWYEATVAVTDWMVDDWQEWEPEDAANETMNYWD